MGHTKQQEHFFIEQWQGYFLSFQSEIYTADRYEQRNWLIGETFVNYMKSLLMENNQVIFSLLFSVFLKWQQPYMLVYSGLFIAWRTARHLSRTKNCFRTLFIGYNQSYDKFSHKNKSILDDLSIRGCIHVRYRVCLLFLPH